MRGSVIFVYDSENKNLTGKLSWLRTSVAPLNSLREFSVYASVVNWLLSSRQSPTVADIAVPLPEVVWTVLLQGHTAAHILYI